MSKGLFRKAMDVVLVNFIWIVISLLGIFITLGASTTAMFRVINKLITKEGPTSIFKDFWEGFKENFFFSTIIWILICLVGTGLYIIYLYCLDIGNDMIVVLCYLGFYQLIIFFIYFFPTLAVFKTDKPLTMIKNVIILANTNLWTNIKVLGSLAFVIILVYYVHEFFIILAVGIYGFLVAFHLQKTFKPFIEQFEIPGEE